MEEQVHNEIKNLESYNNNYIQASRVMEEEVHKEIKNLESYNNNYIQAARVMEEQVDDEIKNLEKLDEDDLEAIKRRRLGIVFNTGFCFTLLFLKSQEVKLEHF